MVVVLGISHKDAALAVRWLHWVSWLCMSEGGDSSALTLVLFGTRRVSPDTWDALRRFHYRSDCMFQVEPSVCPDERETGYPGCATHLFYRALEYCERHHHGHPILWCEPDTTPMRPRWAQMIAEEYEEAGKPFLGVKTDSAAPHMPGVAVYPPNWRELSPCLGSALTLPDVAMWGKGKSQAWDTACAGDIVPLMAESKRIFQIWKPKKAPGALLLQIPKEVALFHQDKRGLLPGLIDPEYAQS